MQWFEIISEKENKFYKNKTKQKDKFMMFNKWNMTGELI